MPGPVELEVRISPPGFLPPHPMVFMSFAFSFPLLSLFAEVC